MVKILQDTITKDMVNILKFGNIFKFGCIIEITPQYTFNNKTIKKSKESISKKKIDEKVALTLEMVQESIDNMKGACMIVYPMVIFIYMNKAIFSFRDYHHTILFKQNLKIAKISVDSRPPRYL